MAAMTLLCGVIAYATTSNLLLNRAAKTDEAAAIAQMQRTIDAWADERKALKARFDDDHRQLIAKQRAMDRFTAEVLRLLKSAGEQH